jgi:hypothetical protein
MDPEIPPGGNPATPAPAASDAEPQTETQGKTQTQTPEQEKPFVLSRDEWLDFRREVRNKLKDVIPPQTPAKQDKAETPAAADAALVERFNRLETNLAFEKAVSRSGYVFSEAQLDDMSSLYAIQKPENIGDWIARKADVFGAKKPSPTPAPAPVTASKPTPTPAPGAVVNAGAPASTYPPSAQLATVSRIADIDPVAFKSLSREERMKIQDRIRNGGAKQNPYKRQGK